jgi:hypothetical protein
VKSGGLSSYEGRLRLRRRAQRDEDAHRARLRRALPPRGRLGVVHLGRRARAQTDGGIAPSISSRCVENSLVLLKVVQGKRSSVKWIRNTPTASGAWHDLKLEVRWRDVKGYVSTRFPSPCRERSASGQRRIAICTLTTTKSFLLLDREERPPGETVPSIGGY